jgi:hypothetical protein
VADVSAVTKPNTGVAVYDTYSYQHMSGRLVFEGTSVASPIIASVYALADNASTVTYGSDPCSYLCTTGPGYDGPTRRSRHAERHRRLLRDAFRPGQVSEPARSRAASSNVRVEEVSRRASEPSAP